MNTAKDIAEAIGALGPRDSDIEAIVQTMEASWVVRYGDLDVEIEHDRDTGRLALQCELGVAPAPQRAEIYGTLLKYNLIRGDTGGVTIALNADDAVVQMLDLAGEPVTGDLLLTVIENFRTKARIWRSYVAIGRRSDQPSTESLPLGIRV